MTFLLKNVNLLFTKYVKWNIITTIKLQEKNGNDVSAMYSTGASEWGDYGKQ